MAVCTFALTLSAWGQAEQLLANARLGPINYRTHAAIAIAGSGVLTGVATVTLVALGVPIFATLATTLWIPLLSHSNLWRSANVVIGDLRSPALYSAISSLLRIAAYIAFATLGALTLSASLALTQGAAAVAAIALMANAPRLLQRDTLKRWQLRGQFRAGSAVIVFDAFNALTLRSDLIVLQLVSSSHQVGLYAAPASLTTAALAVSIPAKTRMQSILVEGKPLRAASKEIFFVLAAGALSCVGLFVVAPWLVPLLFGAEFRAAVAVTQVLAVAVPGLLMLDMAQGALASLGNRTALIQVGATSSTLVISLLAILARNNGALGAAIACSIAYGAAAAVAWAIALTRVQAG